jgi:hypothetical protein
MFTRPKVLLFYEKHVWDYLPGTPNRTISGFYAWYLRLVKALRKIGCLVYENDFGLAQRNPEYPVGLVGTPPLLERWNLPNPAVIGPSMYDHPKLNPRLFENSAFKAYLLTCDWLLAEFRPFYGDRCVLWFAGIELDEWPDTKGLRKDIDVLVYDKIRWSRQEFQERLRKPIEAHLAARELTCAVLEYGNISHSEFKAALARSRAMLFLCEHETQGMAYQEALASNVPVLAWNPGLWLDPQRTRFVSHDVSATSVPYFSPECGETFNSIHDFEAVFEKFWSRRENYSPRHYVEQNLSLKASAERYLEIYRPWLSGGGNLCKDQP